MQADILAIGSEVTSGQTVNTNAAYLARQLQALGIVCRHQTAVPDDRDAIVEALQEAIRRAALVIVTGGLGPTFDDLTTDAIAHATGRPLIFLPQVARTIRMFYRRHHRRLSRLALRQASVPHGATPLPNPLGTAPGLWLPLNPALARKGGVNGRLLVALPGVPREMQVMWERYARPRVRRLARGPVILSRTLRTVGIVELQIQQILRRIQTPASVQVGLYPHLRAVDVRLTVTASSSRTARRILDRLERTLRRRLGDVVYGTDAQTLEGAVGERLVRRRTTLAVAESCTGGLVSDRITNVSGSSRYFLLTAVVYHNTMKERLLNVPLTVLRRHGAVSAPVVQAMAQGVRRLAGSDLGLAITGIAGPTGGTPKKPVGLVYLALSDRRRTRVQRHHFHGDRLAIKHQAAQVALDWLRRWVGKSADRAGRAPAPRTAARKTSACSGTASGDRWSRAEAASKPPS